MLGKGECAERVQDALESGRGGLCILLAKAAQEGVGKPGLRSVPCRQILTTRNYFTPFSKTQGQLENAAGLQDVSKSYPLSGSVEAGCSIVRALPLAVHCSARPPFMIVVLRCHSVFVF